jgi:hypothetical protein
VHGDDITSEGPRLSLDRLEAEIAKHYKFTVSPRLGPGPADAKEGRCLNRAIRWCDKHIEYEADPRQAEKLVAECGLEGAKPVATPGVKSSFHDLEEDKPLADRLHTAFRGSAARGNYLAMDRPDIQYAAKEICRWMAAPTEASVVALKRLGRYLQGSPCIIFRYPWQSAEKVDAYSDTDWAGCPKTRKSTNGGVLYVGVLCRERGVTDCYAEI